MGKNATFTVETPTTILASARSTSSALNITISKSNSQSVGRRIVVISLNVESNLKPDTRNLATIFLSQRLTDFLGETKIKHPLGWWRLGRFDTLGRHRDHLALKGFIYTPRWQIVLQSRLVNLLGETVTVFAQIKVRSLDKLKGILLIVADQAQRSLRRADHFGDELGPVGNRGPGRCQAALDGAIHICPGRELTKSLVLSEKVLRDLKHGGIDSSGL